MVVPKFRVWDVHNKKMFTESELVIWNGNVYANDYQNYSHQRQPWERRQ
ncbi:hypothetical protein [Streptococcus suis]|uniref:Uncharacterized protein n=1 Tax=Streptococcus suis TaxID=1307 RepID=A0A123U822_STRSU|nr:hypothetical protein [Streptococcus suis]NQF83509.1 hypothetical protein [Streptococcus suis]NQH66864.1 hypothetical protein [Streptococcus suis]NQH79293.1 hypothetical protein [Streptococcus suis]NQM08197.1 hypothetical protein [Streptococcus suis]NQM27267.1 hypothetical protein [Streptococcus suis]